LGAVFGWLVVLVLVIFGLVFDQFCFKYKIFSLSTILMLPQKKGTRCAAQLAGFPLFGQNHPKPFLLLAQL
jgi:hypothetical protein